jgi:hypothetical protein
VFLTEASCEQRTDSNASTKKTGASASAVRPSTALQYQRRRERGLPYGLDDYTEGRIVGAANLGRKIAAILRGNAEFTHGTRREFLELADLAKGSTLHAGSCCNLAFLRPMPHAEWHLVRAGHVQIIGSQKRVTGDPFLFVPLFRTHGEANQYCRHSTLWRQGVRPRHNRFTTRQQPAETLPNEDADFRALLDAISAEGVSVIGLFVGFNTAHESCWDYFSISTGLRPLMDDEGPV